MDFSHQKVDPLKVELLCWLCFSGLEEEEEERPLIIGFYVNVVAILVGEAGEKKELLSSWASRDHEENEEVLFCVAAKPRFRSLD